MPKMQDRNHDKRKTSQITFQLQSIIRLPLLEKLQNITTFLIERYFLKIKDIFVSSEHVGR
jgi:hypothetical protein